jgi:dTDP-4-amino-4,6-dideoxygalactose transaminase
MYPIVFPSSGDRDQIATYLRSHGIGTSSPYEEAIQGAAKNYGYEGDCPSAESLLKRTLVIPSFYALKSKDIEHILRCVNHGWAEISGMRTA